MLDTATASPVEKLRRPHRIRRRVAISAGSVAGVLVLLLALVLILGGILVPAHYLEPWSKSYPAKFSDLRMRVVSQALLAPSSHNMQPWTIRLDPANRDAFSLYADPTRLTPAVDPLARQTMVSQGTFLAYLTVAAAHLGYRATETLFPDGTYNESALATSMTNVAVARITLTRDSALRTRNYDSLYLSDTNRDPYTTKKVTASQTAALESLATGSGASLRMMTSSTDVARLGAFGKEGTLIESKDAAVTRESDRLFYGTEGTKNAARSGFGVEGQGTSGFMKYFLQGAIRLDPALNDDATGAKRAIASTDAAVAATPAYGMITTDGNTRADQVRAGILYADFDLTARTMGLVMQPLSQVLQEYPSMAALYRAIHAEYARPGQTIQMLVRVGTSTVAYPPTMRRDAKSLLDGK